MVLGSFFSDGGPRRWTTALWRLGAGLDVAVEHGSTDEGASQPWLVRARAGPPAAELRVVAPDELASRLGDALGGTAGLVLDLSEASAAMARLLRELEASQVSELVPIVVIALPGEVTRVAWASVPPGPNAEARAARVCRALARGAPEDRARARGVLRERLSASAREARTREAMLVHDLRSPLAVVRGGLEMLADPGASSDESTTVLELVGRALREVEDVIARLEARYASGGEPSREGMVELSGLAREITDGLRCTPGAQGKRLRVRSASEQWIRCDRQDLARMLDNLAGNALRHARESVEVVIDGDASAVTLLVRDDGPGISASMEARLFGRFVRNPAGRMGLGLAIVRTLAERYGGSVAAANRSETEGAHVRGACFTVRLPKNED